MIKIKRIQFENMFSYRDKTTVDFSNSTLTQLVGDNGAGKSSIPTILEELLYNKNSRGVKKADIPYRYSDTNNYWGSVEFEVAGDIYVLKKDVKSTAKVSLSKNGEDISGHTATQTYKKVEGEILQLDFDTFTKLVYQSMNSALDFLKATDSNRKKFLISLLGLEKYTTIHENLKVANSEARENLKSVEGKLSSVEEFLNKNPKDLEPAAEPEVPEDTTGELRDEIAHIQKLINDHNKISEQIERVKKVREQVDSLRKSIIEVPEEDKERILDKPDLRTKLDKLKTDKSAIDHEVKSLNSQIRSLKSKTGKCPTCGQALEGSNHAQEHLEQIEKVLESEKLALNSINKKINDVDSKLEKINTIEAKVSRADKDQEAYSNKLDLLKELEENVPETMPGIDGLEDDKVRLTASINSIQKDIEAARAEQLRVAKHNSKVEQINELRAEYLGTRKSLVEEQSKEQHRLGLMKILLDAFGPKGLIQYKIESSIKAFEKLINDYLVELTDGEFSLVFEIEDSKLKINIYQHGTVINVNSASSGEFNNINTATLLAVRKLMTSISKVDINLLFLDEVISVLSTNAKNNLIDILLAEKNLNSVIVSHGFEHPLADTIRIVKDGKASCLTGG